MTGPHDLVLTGATVLDPAGRCSGRYDVAVRDGVISEIAPGIRGAATEVDLTGAIVTPGFVDVHAHVFDGVGGSVPGDEACLGRGTTTAVDAGSAGAHTFGAFRRMTADHRMRILSWLNLSTIGIADARVGELLAIQHADVDAAVETAAGNRDLVVGIKTRLSSYVVGGYCEPVLKLMRAAADAAAVPVMVHIGDTGETLAEILPYLNPGDVVTHMLTGRKNGITTAQGAILPAVVEARRRGVLFDAARGGNHLSFRVLRAAVEQDFLPDSLATDITRRTALDPAHGLALLCTELMSFGLDFERLLPMVTSGPARMIGRPDLGRIAVGGPAELTVVRIEDGDWRLADVDGATRAARRRVTVRGVVHGGRYQALSQEAA